MAQSDIIHFRAPKKLRRKLEAYAKANQVTISDAVRLFVSMGLGDSTEQSAQMQGQVALNRLVQGAIGSVMPTFAAALEDEIEKRVEALEV
jgi:hypothetical protein